MSRKDPYRRWRTAERRARREHRMPWWGHVIVLTLIIGSTGVSVVTGQPLYTYVAVPVAWLIGAVLISPRWRATASRVARNRYVWLLAAGLVFATLAATVATAVAR